MLPCRLFEKVRKLIWCDSRLLHFKARVDLNQQFGMFVLALHFLGEGGNQPQAVDRLDDIKQGNGLRRLVGLQRSDQV